LQRLNAARVPTGSSINVVLCRPFKEELGTADSLHVAENLMEEYVIFRDAADVPIVVPDEAAAEAETESAKKPRGSIFGLFGGASAKEKWEDAADPATDSTKGNMDTDGSNTTGRGADKDEPRSENATSQSQKTQRKSLLQRARASLSWAKEAGDVAIITTCSSTEGIGIGSNSSSGSESAEVPVHSHNNSHSATSGSEGTSEELRYLRETNATLESRAEMYRLKAESAEDNARKAGLELEDVKADLEAAQQSEKRLLEEVAALKKQVLAANANANPSTRTLPLSTAGMHDKVARLKARYGNE